MARRRRSIRIAKGVRLNLGSTGTSMTFSHRGLFGGTKSSTVRLTGGSSSSKPRGIVLQGAYNFNINDDGTVEFYDSRGNRVLDESLIRKMKSTEQFRIQKAQILAQRKIEKEQKFQEEQEAKFKEIQGETEGVISIHKHTPRVITQNECLDAITHIFPKEYVKEEYTAPVPMKDHIIKILAKEAENNVKAPFWKRKKAIEEYIELRANDLYNLRLNEYEENKAAFERNEELKAVEMNKKYIQEAEERKEEIRCLMKNDENYIESKITNWLKNIVLTVDFNVDFEYRSQQKTMYIDLLLPPISDMPTEKAVCLSSGTVKAKSKTQKEIKQDYIQCVFGLAEYVCGNTFNFSTAIRNIVLSGYNEVRDDRTGKMVENCVYSLKVPREAFEENDVSSRDPQEFCLSLESRCNITASLVMKPVESFE